MIGRSFTLRMTETQLIHWKTPALQANREEALKEQASQSRVKEHRQRAAKIVNRRAQKAQLSDPNVHISKQDHMNICWIHIIDWQKQNRTNIWQKERFFENNSYSRSREITSFLIYMESYIWIIFAQDIYAIYGVIRLL